MNMLDARRIEWELSEPFTISRGSITHVNGVLVTLKDASGRNFGRGEAYGVDYLGETPETMLAQIEAVRGKITSEITREELLHLLPAGGARCAIDLAMWDLEAKLSREPAWKRAGLQRLGPLTTSFTIGMRSASELEATVKRHANYPLLKIKVDSNSPMKTLRMVRRAAPKSRVIIDPNQSWSMDLLREFAPECKSLGVELIEQPLPVDQDSDLASYTSPVPLCADELIHSCVDLEKAVGKYQVINIKLDKAGGLTEGLRLAEAAKERGFRLMVGCMCGSSLAMAPAMIVGQLCDYVDLDGPLLQSLDWENAIKYHSGRMDPPNAALWG
jgi:L-alanine-DL-glutamate epimerase-like enolase superfamily enzyme